MDTARRTMITSSLALARSAADGFTLGVVSNNVVIFPGVIKQLPFDMPGDFPPIAIVGSTPMVIVVNKNVAANRPHRRPDRVRGAGAAP